ncbi:ABC-2 type transport system permease protein [Pedobacter steynii]|uniref:ABC-2 type transport system permease protein n=1 Tax=Pedobacter steynii TaxID=430522 RepID=A0A1H0AX23_9SPHI|nr:ABC transporter permease [Pedobacter steynii]NQX41231.1 ABC transporter permease [Pedobacter steynii]SDN38017.1 ABC-2 type transport system permease protein [Pedobacter steynii]
MKNFFALIKREFGLFFADSTLRSVFLLAPIIYALLFGFVYQKGKVEHLPIIVVDLDNTPLSNQLIDMLGENEKLQVVRVKNTNNGTTETMRQMNAVVTVVIPERFEASVLQKRYPEINTYINTTNLLTANMASQGVQTTLGTFSAGINMQGLKKKGMNAGQAATQYEPFKVNYIRLYNETGNYFTYMWPGVLAVVLQQVLLLGLAVSFAREYENKTLEKEFLGRAGNAFSAILIKVIPFWIMSVFILGIYYMFHHIFRAPIPSPLMNYAVTTGLFIAATTFLGVFISALLPSALKATQVLMLLATPAFIIGGYSWPLEAMPIGVQWLSSILPLTPFLNAHKVMLFQQGSLADVMPSIQHLCILILVYGILALITVRIKIYQMKKKAGKEEVSPN